VKGKKRALFVFMAYRGGTVGKTKCACLFSGGNDGLCG